MGNTEELLQCYNKGCGQKFTIINNKNDSCSHHPGVPVFHDAYKGWSCCNKKCTDFTEFLNIKGCTQSKHSNVKPAEPEKPIKQEIDVNEVIEVKPIIHVAKERPPLDSPLKTMIPEIAPSLKQQVSNKVTETIVKNSNEITLGTVCKNGGCGGTYDGSESNNSTCVYHPGVPIFHEGLKFWSCCLKKTTDFNTFLSQPGCENGKHVWIKQNDKKEIQCRWDYHQTASHMVVSVYAKQYCIKNSIVLLNPIRLNLSLVFPEEDNGLFKLDFELQGIVDVEASQLSFYGTKIEIKLKKAEPCCWSRLDIPQPKKSSNEDKTVLKKIADITPQVEAVDLDDL